MLNREVNPEALRRKSDPTSPALGRSPGSLGFGSALLVCTERPYRQTLRYRTTLKAYRQTPQFKAYRRFSCFCCRQDSGHGVFQRFSPLLPLNPHIAVPAFSGVNNVNKHSS